MKRNKSPYITILLVICFAFTISLSCKKANHPYSRDTVSTLEKITSTDYLISLNNIDGLDHALIDIRNPIEFEKGHLEGAINIYAPDVLNEANFNRLKELKEKGIAIILYGSNPNEVVAPFMVLYQLGYDNTKILTVENSYSGNELITKNVSVESSVADIQAFITASVKKAEEQAKPKVIRPVKKVVPVKKKKKMPIEGGC